MAQCKLSTYYASRKKKPDSKLLKSTKNEGKSSLHQESWNNVVAELTDAHIKAPSHLSKEPASRAKLISTTESNTSKDLPEQKNVKTKAPLKTQLPKPKVRNTKAKVKKQTKTIDKNTKLPDIRDSFQSQRDSEVSRKNDVTVEKSVLNLTYTVNEKTPDKAEILVRTPKRNLSNPDDANTDSKKKKRTDLSVSNLTSSAFASDDVATINGTPNKHPELIMKNSARKNLFVDYESDSLAKKNTSKAPKPLIVNVDSKAKAISSGRLEELKEKLAKFDKTYQKFKEFKSNKCKITSIISSNLNKSPATEDREEEEESVPCFIKYYSLAQPTTTLTLPYKYKLLLEVFRCSDTVVSMLNNRKEVCTFDKLKHGVQDMTKRNFTETHLGQIKTVYPVAYNYHIEKNSASVMNRKPGTPLYEFVISPNLKTHEQQKIGGGSKMKSSVSSTKSNAFEQMTPACLIERKNVFSYCLLSVVKIHHKNFLAKLDPPIIVPLEQVTKWHPKFPVDTIPEVKASELPEPPNQSKVSNAKDLLNKIRGSAGSKVEKALQLVIEKNSEQDNTQSGVENKTVATNRFLKNISSDLLQRIRARESARIVEDMTKNPKDKKRAEMMERVPEIVRILRTYFITARRAAVSLEEATEKIMDSYHSTINPEEVRNQLQLIADIFPKWLFLIPIRKGLFLKIDKNKDINDLLNNLPAL